MANARASFKAPIEHGETIADVKPLLVPLRPPALEVAGCMSRVAPSEHPSEGGADDRTGRRRTLTRVDPHAAGLHHGSRRLPILSRHARSSSGARAKGPTDETPPIGSRLRSVCSCRAALQDARLIGVSLDLVPGWGPLILGEIESLTAQRTTTIDFSAVPEMRDIELVLVTGAGASCAFGADNARLPLMPDWSDRLVEKLRERNQWSLAMTGLESGLAAEEFEDRLGRFLRAVAEFKSSRQLVAPLIPDEPPPLRGQEPNPVGFELEELIGVIYKTLYEMFAAPHLDGDLAQDAYARLLHSLRMGRSPGPPKEPWFTEHRILSLLPAPPRRWVYATTNYDTIGEEAIEAIGGRPDVGEVRVRPRDLRRFEIAINPDGLLDRMPDRVPVLYLHGRVGWFWGEEGPTLMSHRNPAVERSFDPHIVPTVILPSLQKAYDRNPHNVPHPFVSSIWRQFEAALSRAKRVFVLGHSLHDQALVRALANNVDPLERLAVTYLGKRDDADHGVLNEPADAVAASVRERVESELPGAAIIPIRFEAAVDFQSQQLTSWLDANP